MRIRSRPGLAAALALSLCLTGLSTLAAAAEPPPRHQKKLEPPAQVTLITGDRVLLSGDEPRFVPARGRERVGYRVQQFGDQLYVIPADMLRQVAAGRLDRALFDVKSLVRDGYDDARSTTIPLLVTYHTSKVAAPAGTSLVRRLPAINAAAVRLSKKNPRNVLAAPGIRKVWLDSKLKLTLDQSVAQIGAPAAWQAGYTGTAVPVAVLDSGIDASHPDLADRVAGARNFTTSPDGDQHGHGTHVASTIAGAAAASDGRYKGVAPGVTLYDGKVCAGSGCDLSAIVAGMEWAATEVKAKVVNMSLGGTDQPGIDPLEEAVNRLTAQTGTLFVISAGNSGARPGAIGSPGSADAALTVGAVDKQDRIADFSSRGPRSHDGALKPDVTAPGADIIAARSKDGAMGTPVDEWYVQASGTSMAAPHVAGAAALLVQRHPDWKADQLKAALMGTAKVNDGQTVHDQGVGRIDVAKAVTAKVVADTGSLWYGRAQWPHHDDTPVTKQLSYRNLGEQPVTLRLSATMTAPDGQPAPAGAVKLSQTELTVPAGGTASVQLTSTTRHHGPDGHYTGHVVATAEGVRITTITGVHKEVESYDVTIKHVDSAGRPSPDGIGVLAGADELHWIEDSSGAATVRVPAGEYMLLGEQLVERAGDAYDVHFFLQPRLAANADTTVVLDARDTRPVQVTVPEKEAALVLGVVAFWLETPSASFRGRSGYVQGDRMFTAQVGEAVPAEQLRSLVTTTWGRRNTDGSFANSPYMYDQRDSMTGFPTGLTRTVRSDELAVVDQVMNAGSGLPAFVSTGSLAAPWMRYDLPAKRRVYLDAGDRGPIDSGYSTLFDEVDPDLETAMSQLTAAARYRPGRAYREHFNAAVLSPGPGVATREGNLLSIYTDAQVDAAGHIGASHLSNQDEVVRLYRNGEQVFEGRGAIPRHIYLEVPEDKATYKMTSSTTRSSIFPFSSQLQYDWTFASEHAAALTMLPAVSARFQPLVNGRNLAERQATSTVPFVLDAQQGAALPRIARVEVQVSGDDGATWTAAKVRKIAAGRYVAAFAPPAGSTVSLRTTIVDGEGSVTEQTVIDAYGWR